MAQCRLRFAFGQHRGGSFGGSAATRIGSICHAVLDAAVKNEVLLGEGWKADVEALWDSAVAAEEARARGEGVMTPARGWPGYQIKRARLFRVAGQVRGFLRELPEDAEVLPEQSLAAKGGRLYGRADLVIRGKSVHRILDYKSGSVTDAEGEPREAYVRQLQLYALLEYEVSGTWPETAHLFPLEGAPVEIEVDPSHCLRVGEEALALIDDYNSAVPGPQPATPAAGICRWCPYATGCDAFWAAVDESWADEVRAARGVGTNVFSTPVGGVTVEIETAAGSVPLGSTVIKQIDPALHRDASRIIVGSAVSAVGLVPDAHGAGYWLGASGALAADGS